MSLPCINIPSEKTCKKMYRQSKELIQIIFLKLTSVVVLKYIIMHIKFDF